MYYQSAHPKELVTAYRQTSVPFVLNTDLFYDALLHTRHTRSDPSDDV